VSYASQYIHGLTQVDKATGVTLLTVTGILFAVVLMLLFFVLNYFGIKLLGRVNTVVTWWKFILPALTFILLLFVFNGSNFTAGTGGFFAQGVPAISRPSPRPALSSRILASARRSITAARRATRSAMCHGRQFSR